MPRFRFRLIPREERFFEDFVAFADQLCSGSKLLEEMMRPDAPVLEKAAEIKTVEHRCDELAHEVLRRLHRTFVVPIDREDIHALLRALDDVIDDIDASADMVRLYRIARVRPAARELARMITAACKEIHRGMAALEARKGVIEIVQEIARIRRTPSTRPPSAISSRSRSTRSPMHGANDAQKTMGSSPGRDIQLAPGGEHR